MEALVNYSSEDEHDDDEGFEIRVNSPYAKDRKKNQNAECQRIIFCVYILPRRRACSSVYKHVCVCV